VIPTTSVSKQQLKSNPMEDRVMRNNSQGKKQEVQDHRRNVKFSKNKMSVTACHDTLNVKIVNVNFVCATCDKCVLNKKHDMCVLNSCNGVKSKTKMPIAVPLIEIVLFIVDSGCSKHMMGNLKLLINFVEKFLGTVKFGNDQITPILGYGDLSTCYIRDLKGNDLLTGILHQTSVARTPEQNGVVERRNRTLVEAARTMLSAVKVPLFFWVEAIATPCFTQNRSLVIPRHEKTPYHIINDWKPSVKFFYIFGSLCYIVRDGENLNKMKEKVVSKSSAINTADAPTQRQKQHTTPLTNQTTIDPTCQVPIQAPTVASTENINQAEMIAENTQIADDEFINIFCTPEELHQFDRLDVWELVERPLCKNVINKKWL
nr:putative ribonuclease H-like domain-containing protein [Tanacetum cinerariifolium]